MENPERDWPSSNNLNHKSKKSGEKKDPEEAYLGIHANVRAAMKKHLPWVTSMILIPILFRSLEPI